jgi:oligopeptidase B
MRDARWQDVLQDPTVLDREIKAHLDAENQYYEAMTADLAELRATLVAEMRGRMQEDDSTLPVVDGPFAYYSRYEQGAEYPIYARKAVLAESLGEEQILFDANKAKGDHAFFAIGGVTHSPDHTKLAVSTDTLGSERMQIAIIDIASGRVIDNTVTDTSGWPVWSADSQSFFYAAREPSGKSLKIMHHALGSKGPDRLVFEETNTEFDVGVTKTQNGRFIVIESGNFTSSEVWVMPAAAPETPPRLFAARQENVEYDIDQRGEQWFIRTNYAGAVDFQIMQAPLDADSPADWSVFEPYRPGRQIAQMVTYDHYIVWAERENATEGIAIADYEGNVRRIAFDQPAYEVNFYRGYAFNPPALRVAYESPSQPEQIIDYDFATLTPTVLKTEHVPSGHDPDLYVVEMVSAKAEDGAEIPVMVLRLKDTPLDGSAPALLYGYGSYGVFLGNPFSTAILSLVDRGVIFARAHIRGGSAKGEQWYLDGKLAKKQNTFNDFVAAGEMLVDNQYTSAGHIVIHGGSAGGLLVGAAVNLKPTLFAGVLAAVPFVDVINTISDETLPLTPPEWKEWGNPITQPEEYDWIAAYSPYDNIRAGTPYPPILATGGLTDYRVTYWEPAKWIARLRAEAQGGPMLLRMNMSAGHAGSAARFERIDEYAHLYAVALKWLGKTEVTPVSHDAGNP